LSFGPSPRSENRSKERSLRVCPSEHWPYQSGTTTHFVVKRHRVDPLIHQGNAIKLAVDTVCLCCHSAGCGTEVLNDNFSCTWTLCSTEYGDGWPQRLQLQPGVPSLGRCVTLLPATFCNLGLGDPLSSCNKRIVFISYSFLLGKPTAATIGNSSSTIAHRLMIVR
jgi:hypothetical protein